MKEQTITATVGPNFKSDPKTTEVFQTEIGIHTMEFPITCIKKTPVRKSSIKTKDAIKTYINSFCDS